jgi:predicted Zn-ribbon and HTH transcriptional regulator
MATEELLLAYVAVLLTGLGGLTWYSSRRQKRFGPRPSDDRVFRCEKCAYVYTDDPDVDRSRCQQCGTLNEAIRF